MLKDWEKRARSLKDCELRPSTDEERKIVQRRGRLNVRMRYSIWEPAPEHNYSPHIMKLDQFVRSCSDYDSIF